MKYFTSQDAEKFKKIAKEMNKEEVEYSLLQFRLKQAYNDVETKFHDVGFLLENLIEILENRLKKIEKDKPSSPQNLSNPLRYRNSRSNGL